MENIIVRAVMCYNVGSMGRNRRFKLSLRVLLMALVLCGAVLASSTVFQVRADDLSQMRVSFEPKDNTGKYVYLSDLALDTTRRSHAGWGSLLFNQTDTNGRKISMRYDGSVITLDKGIWAHASSNVYYNLEELGIVGEYDYLTAFVGLNTTAASSSNGVIFWIYGSENGTDWDVIYNEERKVSRPGENADFVKVGIKKYKYLRLQAYDNGANGNDHAVWGDLKLIKSDYDPYVVPAVGDFNEYFEKAGEVEIANNSAYELTLLRRSLIRYTGQYALSQFATASTENREVLEWLYNDLGALRYYITGGKPVGSSYQNSLGVLARLYQAHKDDLNNDTVTDNGVRLGDLYERMMIAEALVYSANVGSWVGGSQYSDAVARYEVFKRLYEENRLDRKVFESLEIEEMRWVLDTMITDPEVDWLNYYSKKENSVDPYHYIRYTFGYNYGLAKYYAAENEAEWDQKYDLAQYNVPYGEAGKPKLWMVFEEGSVCGGLSKTGTNINNTWGYPASVVGQPGHAAYLIYRQDADGNGYWGIGNNISGWTRSEKSERLLLGWGSNNWDSYYQVSYVPYAQEALNDMDNYIKAHETLLLADLYGNDYDKLEEIYRKALSYQNINMDAWYGLIQLYNADGRKTEADFVRLAQDLAEALAYYPLPMWDLTNLIKPHMNTAVGEANFEKARRDALQTALAATKNDTQQPDVSITMANYLLNNNDLSVASFSFDGENAGKIVMAERYFSDSITTTWEYSIDGKQTWSAPISTRSWQLTPEEIAQINVDDDVVIHIVGAGHDSDYAIDIVSQELSTNLYANDLENRVVGVTDVTEWRLNSFEPWTSYTVKTPDLTGNKVIQVRTGATGTKLASEHREFAFTEDNQPETRKYIPVSHLSIAGVSTEATGQGRYATNAIDGNYNTNWHSDWRGRDTERYIVIKLDQPMWLSAVEYVPAGGGNGKLLDGELYGSMDGENWEVLAVAKNWANNETVKSFELDEPKEVQYIKIHAEKASNGNWFTARMFNLFRDATRQPTVDPEPEEPEPPVDPTPDDPDKPKPDQPDDPNRPDEPDPEKPSDPDPERPGDPKPDEPTPEQPGDNPSDEPGEQPSTPVIPTTPVAPNERPGTDVGGNVIGQVPVSDNSAGNTVFDSTASGDDDAEQVVDAVKVQSRVLILTDSLKQKFGAGSEYFEFYLVDADGNRITDTAPTKFVITLAGDKEFKGVYRLGDGDDGENVEYKRLDNNKIELLVPNTGRYIVAYDSPANKDVVQNEDTDTEENKSEFNTGILWWIIVGVVVLGLITGGMMVSNRRR